MSDEGRTTSAGSTSRASESECTIAGCAWAPGAPGVRPRPYEALEEFLAGNPGLFSRDSAREEKSGFTAAPRGYLIRTAQPVGNRAATPRPLWKWA